MTALHQPHATGTPSDPAGQSGPDAPSGPDEPSGPRTPSDPGTPSNPGPPSSPDAALHPPTDSPPHPTTAAFALLGTVQATLIFTLAALAVPLPRIGRQFGLAHADLILLSASYGLAFAGLLLFGGRLADRYGGRPVFAAGLVVFAASSVLVPLAPTYPVLLGARFGQGVGAALTAPAAMALLRALFPRPAAYGRAMATWGGLNMLGATAGNVLSGVATALWSWRAALAVPVLVAAAALTLAPRLLPGASRRDAPTEPAALSAPTAPIAPTASGKSRPALDLPGALLATAGVTLVSYGLVVSDTYDWISGATLVPLLAGAVLLAAFLAVELRVRDPLLPPRFLRDRRRAVGLLAVAVTAAGASVTFVVLSLQLQEERGWSALQTSAAFIPFAVAQLAAARAAAPLIARFGAARTTAYGLGTAATGLGLIALTGLAEQLPYAYSLLPGTLLLPAGAAVAFAGAAVLSTDRVPAGQAGLAGGVFNTAMEVGASAVFAAAIALGGDAATFAALAVAFVAVALLNSLPNNHR
ncbi:MFS transporter [Streptomyces sp. TRM66268-LWL]|uniref:MFS transporter n=1 Tax=Streptomyces polyasparticus TaxID=2767826 RepID=A0ABR7SL49_9ACTN|nr:MFS transporter [Streptomyces polyasparticus]MBC9716148.1 MFS transporter [Streptomyces polyasparticus]